MAGWREHRERLEHPYVRVGDDDRCGWVGASPALLRSPWFFSVTAGGLCACSARHLRACLGALGWHLGHLGREREAGQHLLAVLLAPEVPSVY